MSQAKNRYAMQDPTTQYPAPKFNDQPQSAPGTVHDMDPGPDHGEEAVRASRRSWRRSTSCSPRRSRAT